MSNLVKVHIPSRTPFDICIFIFAEEGNSSGRNVQYTFLASVNFLISFYQIFNMPGYTPNIFNA